MINRNVSMENCFRNYLQTEQIEKKGIREIALLLLAVEKMYQATQDDNYKSYVIEKLHKLITEKGTLSEEDKVNSDSLDQYLFGNAVFFAVKYSEDQKYTDYVKALAAKLAEQSRLEDGVFTSVAGDMTKTNRQILAGAYATQVFYMNYESKFGGKEHYNDIIAQFNSLRADYYDKVVGNMPESEEALAFYLCSLIDTMEVMEQPLYEIFRRLQDLYKETYKVLRENGMAAKEENSTTAAFEAYAVLKGCRMKALQTEKYEAKAEQIVLDKIQYAEEQSPKLATEMSEDATYTAAVMMSYAEGIRNREYQDYGRGKGGALWS